MSINKSIFKHNSDEELKQQRTAKGPVMAKMWQSSHYQFCEEPSENTKNIIKKRWETDIHAIPRQQE